MKNNTLHKIWNILDSVQRKNTIKILFLVVIGAFLEMISIGLIFPVVSIFIKSSNSIEEPPETIPLFMDIAHEVFGNNDFYIILSILISAFIFKNIFLSYSVVRQSKHVFNVSSNLSVKLFYIYLHKPFIDLIKYDSSTIIRNIVNEINVLTNSGLLAGLSLIVELFVLVGLFVLLAVISPIGVLLITSIVGGSAYIFYMITKKMSRKYGKRRQYYEGQRIKNVKQAFLGIKEIKLNMHEVITIDEYRKNCLAVSRAASNHHILQQLPRLWLEFFIVIALSLSLLVIVLSNQNPINFIPVIGVFSAAAFRLIPSFNKILNSASSLGYISSIVDILNKNIISIGNTKEESLVKEVVFKKEILVDGITCNYNKENLVLSNLNMIVPFGSIIGIVGNSGSGKSTLINNITGLLRPTKGKIYVDGEDIFKNLAGWRKIIGYAPQEVFLIDDTISNNITFDKTNNVTTNDKKIKSALDAAQLTEFVNSLPDGLNTIVGDNGILLSGGQRHRIALARLFYSNPLVWILDEATSKLDSEIEGRILKRIQSYKGVKTVIIISHNYNVMSYGDTVYRLENNQITVI